jgi:ABC-type transport system substrate-binding protein
MKSFVIRFVLVAVLLLLVVTPRSALAAPEGTMTWGVHVTLAARWLDPSDTEAFITPFMVLYALHDALVKPMPGGDNTPSLAESWTMSKDGQQIMYDRVMHVPIYELAFLWGVGPRVDEACVDHIKGFSYSAPYEDLKLKPGR